MPPRPAARLPSALLPYRDVGGDSGISSYALGPGTIAIEFSQGGCYLYDNVAPGTRHVAEMIRRAQQGEGLNTYINQHVRDRYAHRLW